jgi:hypothetical protein
VQLGSGFGKDSDPYGSIIWIRIRIRIPRILNSWIRPTPSLMKIASLDVQRHLTLDTSCIGWKWMACKRRRVGYHKIVCVLIFLHDYNLKNVTESLREIRVSKKSLKKSNLT